MQQTTNYKLNIIEKTDKILDSIDKLNENFNKIDETLGDYETAMNELIEGAGV